jgi:hypothetical protein
METTVTETNEKFLTQKKLLRDEAFENLSVSKFEALRRQGLLPYIRAGRRTFLYRKSAVLEALLKLEVK